ncbi:gamma-glutamyltransferase [Microvirga arabica]|uniref:gamma-glutamyltransferase n=1 Tax=Microvirga arabica TaxID=1128671 RepID=UPI003621C779
MGAALELSRALGGQLPLDLLLGDAIRYARDGYPVSRSEERFVTGEEAALYEVPGFAEAFLVEGKRAPEGTQRRTPRLADTLEQLAHAGLADFYRGDVGREIALDLERIGSPIIRKDLEDLSRPRGGASVRPAEKFHDLQPAAAEPGAGHPADPRHGRAPQGSPGRDA